MLGPSSVQPGASGDESQAQPVCVISLSQATTIAAIHMYIVAAQLQLSTYRLRRVQSSEEPVETRVLAVCQLVNQPQPLQSMYNSTVATELLQVCFQQGNDQSVIRLSQLAIGTGHYHCCNILQATPHTNMGRVSCNCGHGHKFSQRYAHRYDQKPPCTNPGYTPQNTELSNIEIV